MRRLILLVTVALGSILPAPALAQRFAFERSLDVTGPATLDVSTIRGKIEVTAGDPGRIVVSGAATVRIGLMTPARAEELARKVAADPPIVREGKTIRLRPPAGADDQRAMTVNYVVRVPPDTEVITVSDSGATTIDGVSGRVAVRTGSAAVSLTKLGGAAEVRTGSGAVTASGVAGALRVTTESSAFKGWALGGGVSVRTQSGAVEAALAGDGDVDVQSGSSAIRLRNVTGALTAVTESGRVTVQGAPGRAWDISTGSGQVRIDVERRAAFTLDAKSETSNVTLSGASVPGSAKGRIAAPIGGGGPTLRVTTRSGAVGITVAGH
jgi:putative adhesin